MNLLIIINIIRKIRIFSGNNENKVHNIHIVKIIIVYSK